MIVGARQSFQSFRQIARFLGNNRALCKLRYWNLYNLLVLANYKKWSIKWLSDRLRTKWLWVRITLLLCPWLFNRWLIGLAGVISKLCRKTKNLVKITEEKLWRTGMYINLILNCWSWITDNNFEFPIAIRTASFYNFSYIKWCRKNIFYILYCPFTMQVS